MAFQPENNLQPVSVSIAMATFNGESYIAEQLASFTEQTLLPDELVVSDDGSTDNTLDIVATFASHAPFPVRVLTTTHRPRIRRQLFRAINLCRGDVVALSDQDDVWLPLKLATGVRRLIADNSLLSMHQLTMTDETLVPTEPWNQGIVRDATWRPLELNPLAGWGNTMVSGANWRPLCRRLDRPRHLEQNKALSHDTWLYILAAAFGHVSHIAKPLILYRQHGANACGMAKPPVSARLKTMATVPAKSYRERDVFFGSLATVFSDVADFLPDVLAERARAAAERYKERQSRAHTRSIIHDGSTLSIRAAALWRLYSAHPYDDASLRALGPSALKDLILGVTGWGTHV